MFEIELKDGPRWDDYLPIVNYHVIELSILSTMAKLMWFIDHLYAHVTVGGLKVGNKVHVFNLMFGAHIIN